MLKEDLREILLFAFQSLAMNKSDTRKLRPRRAARPSAVILCRPVPGLNKAALTRFTLRAQRAIGLHGEVNTLVAGNEELQALNSRFRGKPQTTDVLSFPAMSKAGDMAGDLAISADLAAANARRLGHAPAEEVKILILHGLLHLAGYDHELDQGEMARRELRLRQQLGLPAGLLERNGHSGGTKRKALTAKGAKDSPRAQRKKRAMDKNRRVQREAR